MDRQSRKYTVEFDESEAKSLEAGAEGHGVSTTDFVAFCARAYLFGINYATRNLARLGLIGTEKGE
jgi:hypothetical protein